MLAAPKTPPETRKVRSHILRGDHWGLAVQVDQKGEGASSGLHSQLWRAELGPEPRCPTCGWQ